jgi:3-oxoacyl-[acyl-carrier-protein] synthase III
MYLAHSNILSTEATSRVKVVKPKSLTKNQEFERHMAYKAYKKALKDNEEAIEEIQKTFPGWVPVFEY